VAVDGEVRQLVEVKLNVVTPKVLGGAISPALPKPEAVTLEANKIKDLGD